LTPKTHPSRSVKNLFNKKICDFKLIFKLIIFKLKIYDYKLMVLKLIAVNDNIFDWWDQKTLT
jgi:hypothetical protein